MPYLWLIFAILLEVTAITFMKLSNGFTRLVPSILMFVFYGGCFACLCVCIKQLDISLAYAIWSALGTACIATIGFVWFKEPASTLRIVGLVLVIAGVVALQFSERPAKTPTPKADPPAQRAS
jgi:small multidrug resistance pump